ncbi:MAG: ABC transporter ATP-binding protein [Leptospirales bacterium]|nr:ABC transporter ATP-binding protein [Leptospirales bacterium]
MIRLRGVTKSFKDLRAVDALDLDIHRGEYTALLGPNGAGKTTLVEMMEGIQTPDSGEILLFGKSWKEAERELRQRIGLSLQETRFIDKLTVLETMKVFGSFLGVSRERILETLASMNLEDKEKTFVVNLSGGQRQRLALGVALMSKPEILLLDEPTTGLDPHARREIWTILEQLKSRGTTLILTTHYMEEAQHLCERIIVLDHGKIIAQGQLTDLLSDGGGEMVVFKSARSPSAQVLQKLRGVLRVELSDGGGRLIVSNMLQVLPKFIALMKKLRIAVHDVECRKMTLDDIFISLTGRHLTE